MTRWAGEQCDVLSVLHDGFTDSCQCVRLDLGPIGEPMEHRESTKNQGNRNFSGHQAQFFSVTSGPDGATNGSSEGSAMQPSRAVGQHRLVSGSEHGRELVSCGSIELFSGSCDGLEAGAGSAGGVVPASAGSSSGAGASGVRPSGQSR